MKYKIYTDGACSGNPGPGGWGAVIFDQKDNQKNISGSEKDTTNNRMELIAAISCLESLEKPTTLTLFTDSNYVKGGITEWMKTWKKNEWKTTGKKSVKNVDLWKRLDKARQKHNVTWKWVKGHSGQTENERADELARQGMAPYK